MPSEPPESEPGGRSSAGAAQPPALAVQGHRATWHDLFLHLRVWLPFLINGYDRRRLVRYLARDLRVGMQWTVELPQCCWQCGAAQRLSPRAWQTTVRCYESALPIAGGAVVALVFVAIAGLWLGWVWTLLSAVLIVAGAALLIAIKSWPEHVDLVLWTCPEHAARVPCPDVVSDDDELYVFLPTETLANEARDQLRQRRQQGRRASDHDASPVPADFRAPSRVGTRLPAAPQRPAPRDDPPDDPPDVRPKVRYAPLRPPEELPPIKLVDDAPIDLPEPDGSEGDNRPLGAGGMP